MSRSYGDDRDHVRIPLHTGSDLIVGHDGRGWYACFTGQECLLAWQHSRLTREDALRGILGNARSLGEDYPEIAALLPDA